MLKGCFDIQFIFTILLLKINSVLTKIETDTHFTFRNSGQFPEKIIGFDTLMSMLQTPKVIMSNSCEPQLSPLKFAEIEDFAQEIALKYGFDAENDFIYDFTEELGGKVRVLELHELEALQSGTLEVHGPSDFTIYLARHTSTFRDNFTMAHELGHYFLHSGNPYGSKQISVDRTHDVESLQKIQIKLEQQANRFAAALLMPKDKFASVAKGSNNNLRLLSGYFKVSEAAAEVRLKSLGLA